MFLTCAMTALYLGSRPVISLINTILGYPLIVLFLILFVRTMTLIKYNLDLEKEQSIVIRYKELMGY